MVLRDLNRLGPLVYLTSGARHQVLQRLINDGFPVKKVLVTSEEFDNKCATTVELACRHAIPVVVIKKRSDALNHTRNSFCLSVGYKYIFSEAEIRSASLILNVHGTLLPRYPGQNTLNWVLVNGDKRSGVTVHKVVAQVDAGPILHQRSFIVSVLDNARSLASKTLDFEPSVVVEALNKLKLMNEDENAFFEEQDMKQYNDFDFGSRVPEDSEIDPSLPLVSLLNHIRACDPEKYPAFFYHGGRKVFVNIWTFEEEGAGDD